MRIVVGILAALFFVIGLAMLPGDSGGSSAPALTFIVLGAVFVLWLASSKR